METKELKIRIPDGYEIDRENSIFECIKFKPIKKNITYKDVCNKLFEHSYYFINERGKIIFYTGKISLIQIMHLLISNLEEY